VEEASRRQWRLDYIRNFGDKEIEEWLEMRGKLEGVVLTEGADKVVWKLEKSGKFTTRSVYKFITFGGVIDLRMMEIWRAKISLKLKIFLWMAWHDRIQTAQQLKRRNWDGSKRCKYCGLEESADHLLFQCPTAMVTWCWVRDSLGWPKIPTSIISYQDLGREGVITLVVILCGG